MLLPLRVAPFFWILAASAVAHGSLFFLTQGALLFPAKKVSNAILPAAFAQEATQPLVESSPKEDVYYRIPVPAPGTGEGPPPAVLPTPLTSRSASPSATPSLPLVADPSPRDPGGRFSVGGRMGKPVIFEKPFAGRSVVFVIDISGSMLEKSGKNTRLQEAFAGVIQAVGGLDPSQRFNVILFADRTDSFRAKLVEADQATVGAAFRYLESDVDCGGSTNLQDALRQAMSMEPEGILLLSDGEANSEDSAILAEMRFLRGRNPGKVRIDTIGFYLQPDSRPELLLKQLARESGGDYAAWNPGLPAALVR